MEGKIPSEQEFQRAGLLALVAQFASNFKVEEHTRLSIKQATLKILNDHPVKDSLGVVTKSIMKI